MPSEQRVVVPPRPDITYGIMYSEEAASSKKHFSPEAVSRGKDEEMFRLYSLLNETIPEYSLTIIYIYFERMLFDVLE